MDYRITEPKGREWGDVRDQISIHPRVQNGRAQHPAINTAMPRRKGLSEAKVGRMEAHLTEHPRDGATSAHLSKMRG